MLIELPQHKILRGLGYTADSLLMLSRRVARWQKKHGDLKRAPGHIQAKAAVLDAVHNAGKK